MSSTYTTVSLDRLIEPGGPKTIVKPPNSRLDRTASLAEKKTQWLQFSPSLYATPEVTPVPDSSSSSFPPSPYIVNHKRRGPRLLKSFSQDDVALNQPATEGETVDADGINANSEVVGSTEDVPVAATVSNAHVEVGENGFHDENIGSSTLDVELVGREDLSKAIAVNSERDCECEDFFDFQESMSFTSNVDMEDSSGPERSLTLPTPKREFYDAWEELSSEGGPQSSHRDIGAELREVRLNLLMEIEKRKQAEESLNNMQRHWQKIVQKLSLVGLTLPTASTIFAEDEHLDLDPGEELSQQIYIARLVSNSIGRGFMRAEVEMEMESQIESKNFEIARLLDRLHYYEAVNHEMSQRNQEAVEMARQHRQRRKRMQKWVWSSIGAAIAVGAASLAWSYLPNARESSSTYHSQAPVGDDAAKP